MHKVALSIFVFVLFFQGVTFSQLGIPQPRTIGFFDSSAVGISFYDDGQIAGFNIGVDLRGEWPLHSGYTYIGDMTPMIGLELPIKDYDGNGTSDTIHSVIISRGPRNSQSSEKDPVDGHFWGWNPLPGFRNLSYTSPAMSTNPNSWPATWADHPEWGSGVWNGFKGPNTFSTTLEAYFKLTDAWDNEFNTYFHPDTTDSTSTGYGITVGVRYFQSNDSLLKNVIIRMYDITNNSDFTYNKVVWGGIVGNLAGGDGDSGDDMAYIDKKNNIIYSWDYDGKGNVGQRVGYFADGFLESPNDLQIGSFRFFPQSASPPMSDDEILWKRLKEGNIDPIPEPPQDGDYIYGTKYFPLTPGETRRVVAAFVFGNSLTEVIQEMLVTRAIWNAQFDESIVLNSIKLLNFDYHRTLTGTENIQWSSTRTDGTVDLWYSADNGETWSQIAESQPNTGSYSLNVDDIEDSPFGIFKIFIKDSLSNIYGFNQSHAVTVDGEINGKPYVKILNKDIFSGDTLTTSTCDMQLLISDTEQDSVNVGLFYSVDGGGTYKQLDRYHLFSDTLPYYHGIYLSSLQNSHASKLKVVVSDDSTLSFDTTDLFVKNTRRQKLDAAFVRLVPGYSNIPYQINIVDTSMLLTKAYVIKFDDTTSTTQKYLTVRDITNGVDLINQEPSYPYNESSIFDGMSFYSEDTITHLDSNKSGWVSGTTYPSTYSFDRFIWATSGIGATYNGYRMPCDYQIEFYSDTVGMSIADTLYPRTPTYMISAKPVNFKVKNLSTNQYIDFTYWKTGTLSTIHNIYFKEQVGNERKRTWRCNIYYYSTANAPLPTNDTLISITTKGLSFLDSILIGNICDVPTTKTLPTKFKIDQNYPNPFNPVTTIKYQIPEVSRVKIEVYNILGQRIATLVDGVVQPGYQSVEWNASHVSSGVYFYRFEASGITSSKIQYDKTGKMIVIK